MHLLTKPSARKVERFELTTRDGRISQYPRPTWLDWFIGPLHSVAKPAVIAVVALGIYLLKPQALLRHP